MLIFVIALNKLVVRSTSGSLASVMIVVSLTTIDWQSIRRIKDMPISRYFCNVIYSCNCYSDR